EIADLAGTGDLARGRDALAGQDLGQGGLAGAVAADETDAVALGDAEGGVLDEDAGTGAQLDTGGGDHGHTPGRTGLAGGRWGRSRRLMREENGHGGNSNGAVQAVFLRCDPDAAARGAGDHGIGGPGGDASRGGTPCSSTTTRTLTPPRCGTSAA